MPAERTIKHGPKRQTASAKQRSNGGGRRQDRSGRGVQRLEGYEPPNYSEGESVYFRRGEEHNLEAKLARPGIRRVTFGADFPVLNEHLRYIGSHELLASSLEMLSLGDESTWNGDEITDDAVLRLVSATPNLRVLRLSCCTLLTDATLVNVLTNCPRLESLRISGNDRVRGKISKKGLRSLRERPEIGTVLKDLILPSQAVFVEGDKEAKALSKAKKGLAVTISNIPGRYDIDPDAPDSVFFNGKMHFFGIPVDDSW